MNESKTMLFGIPRLEEKPPIQENARAGVLDNLPVLFKIAIIALVFMVGLAVVFLFSRSGFASLRFHNENLYNAVLIPISNLQEARVTSVNAVRTLEVLDPRNQLDVESQKGVLEQAGDYVKLVNQVLTRYEKEWITSLNPALTRVLQNVGQMKLQESEVLQFGELLALNKRMNTAFTALQKAKTIDYVKVTEVAGGYFEISDRLQDLIEINNEYAKISASAANADADAATRNETIVSLLSIIVASVIGFFIARAITGRLSTLERGARALREGQLNMQVPVAGRDEIGSVASTLNASISQLRGLLAEQNQERERGVQLQQNVSQFLNVAMDIASGDLTKRGQVSDDVLGNVVDAINLMTEEFGALLGDVKNAASQVSRSSQSMTQTTQSILENAQSQANLAKSAQSQTQTVAEAMQTLAMTADKGAAAAQFTLEASAAGTQAVSQTQEQLNQLRSQMLEMTEKMQNLARRSEEIDEVVRTISRFASQTNLLALGASLEAAGAGSAGARFGAVANAVRSLADDSAKAATKVSSIIKEVQDEIQMLSIRTNSSAEQVRNSTQVAAQAGERLQRISELAQQSAQVAQDISHLANQQAESVQVVRDNVNQIASTALLTESSTRQGGIAAQELQSLSESLAQSLSRFRLSA
ncbi:MAG: methyl-accepting chemotaxis protein [Deinococcales bacterium]